MGVKMKNFRRILAIAGIILLVGMYLCAFVFSFMKSDFASAMFRASLACTFIVPVFLYVMLMVAKVLKPDKSPLIDAIVFDIGDVLVEVRKFQHIDAMDVSDDAKEYLRKYMNCSEIWTKFDTGLYTQEEIVDMFAAVAPKYRTETEEFINTVADDLIDFPYASYWIAGLKQAGYKVYTLSNWTEGLQAEVVEHGNMAFLPITDGSIWSFEEHLIKPDPEMFRRLIEKTGIDPERTVFIDDTEKNTAAAEALGFKTILFKDFNTAVAALRAYNVIFR